MRGFVSNCLSGLTYPMPIRYTSDPSERGEHCKGREREWQFHRQCKVRQSRKVPASPIKKKDLVDRRRAEDWIFFLLSSGAAPLSGLDLSRHQEHRGLTQWVIIMALCRLSGRRHLVHLGESNLGLQGEQGEKVGLTLLCAPEKANLPLSRATGCIVEQ